MAAHRLAPTAGEVRRRLAAPATRSRRPRWAALGGDPRCCRARWRSTLQVNRVAGAGRRPRLGAARPELRPGRSDRPRCAAYAASVPPGTPIFNDANLGGYLIYHTPKAEDLHGRPLRTVRRRLDRAYSDTLGLPPAELGQEFERGPRTLPLRSRADHDQPAREGKAVDRTRTLLEHPEEWREVARGKRAVMFERIK